MSQQYAYELTKLYGDVFDTIIGTRLELGDDTIKIFDGEQIVFAYRGHGLSAKSIGTKEEYERSLSFRCDAWCQMLDMQNKIALGLCVDSDSKQTAVA